MTNQDTDLLAGFAARVCAELLRRKFSVKRTGPKLRVGLGKYDMVDCEVEEADLSIDIEEYADMIQEAFGAYLDKIHEEELEQIAALAKDAPIPLPVLPGGKKAKIVAEIDIPPRTTRDFVQHQFVLSRSTRLKDRVQRKPQ